MLPLKPIVLLGSALITMLIGIPSAATGVMYIKSQTPKAVMTFYNYDAVNDRWVKTVNAVPLPLNEDGTRPAPSNTIEIRLDEDNPVREIIIEEVVVIRGNEPLLEISGHEDNITGNSTGVLRIGVLTFDQVDAEELHIDADVVRTKFENVAAEDNELDLDLHVVNVVRIGRGGPSKLIIGADRTPLTFDTGEIIVLTPTQKNKTGLRVDRIRILGPSTGKGFIEKLTIKKSSVFGRIEVRDVEIQDLILKNVTVED